MTISDLDKESSDLQGVRARSIRKNIMFEAIAGGESLQIQNRHVKRIEVKRGDVLAEAGRPFDYVYLPESAVLTLSSVLESGECIDTINIGNEGIFGLELFSGNDTSYNLCTVQLNGEVIRITAELFEKRFKNNEILQHTLFSYLVARSIIFQQLLACNSLHSVHQRLSRFLLVMHDYAGVDTFPFTHEKLSHALCVDRKSVTLVAQGLQAAGFISYSRGMIKIEDRLGLESTTCECYGVIRAELRRFFAVISRKNFQRSISAKS